LVEATPRRERGDVQGVAAGWLAASL